MIIKIGRKKYPCEVESCKTQKGKDVVRIISEEAPLAENGFTLYTDDESISFDRSTYKYLYRTDGYVREYTEEAEEIIPAQGYKTGVPENPIARALSNLNNRVTEITPYTQSKKAYYGEIEKVFYGVPSGEMTVFFDNEYTTERIEDRVYVRFERLSETKDITIMVQ